MRGRAEIGAGVRARIPQVDTGTIQDEVRGIQAAGRERLGKSDGRLDAVTKSVRGASAQAADETRQW